MNTDRYLLKVLRRARNRFIQHKYSSNSGRINMKQITIDNQSDRVLLDIDEDYCQSIHTDDPDNELLCQSLEAALMETLLELRQLRSNNYNTSISIKNKDQLLRIRL